MLTFPQMVDAGPGTIAPDLDFAPSARPPQTYIDAVYQAVEAGIDDDVQQIVDAAGRSRLAWMQDTACYQQRLQWADDLQEAGRLRAEADELAARGNELRAAEVAGSPQRGSGPNFAVEYVAGRAERDEAERLRARAAEKLGPAQRGLIATATRELQDDLEQAKQTGSLVAQSRDIETRYPGGFDKVLAAAKAEREGITATLTKLLNGQKISKGELPDFAKGSLLWGPARREAAEAIDNREPAVIIAELKKHQAELDKQYAVIMRHHDRVLELRQQVRVMEGRAAEIFRQICDPRSMAWSDL